jgi:hypothetical protein
MRGARPVGSLHNMRVKVNLTELFLSGNIRRVNNHPTKCIHNSRIQLKKNFM